MEASGRGATRGVQETRGSVQETRGSQNTAPVAAPTPAPAEFKTNLWAAFQGTPAPNSTTAANTAAVNSSTTGGSLSTSNAAAGPGARATAATSAGTRSSATTVNTVVQNASTDTPAPAAPPDVLTQVRAALTNAGMNPDEYNLRLGSLTITYPNMPTYEYPVIFADINGQATGFYLNAVAQNPGMFAENVASNQGRPINRAVS